MSKRPTFKTFTRALPLALVLAGCQQASVPGAPTPAEPINLRPEVNLVAEPDNGPAPLTVELSANASDPEGKPLTYYWSIVSEDFPGEDFEGGAVAEYTFTEPGEYTVEVTASDGELDSERASVSVRALSPDEPGL